MERILAAELICQHLLRNPVTEFVMRVRARRKVDFSLLLRLCDFPLRCWSEFQSAALEPITDTPQEEHSLSIRHV